jgi:hypothetical protein
LSNNSLNHLHEILALPLAALQTDSQLTDHLNEDDKLLLLQLYPHSLYPPP